MKLDEVSGSEVGVWIGVSGFLAFWGFLGFLGFFVCRGSIFREFEIRGLSGDRVEVDRGQDQRFRISGSDPDF